VRTFSDGYRAHIGRVNRPPKRYPNRNLAMLRASVTTAFLTF
jgi:hypothetical protein